MFENFFIIMFKFNTYLIKKSLIHNLPYALCMILII